MKVLIFHYKIGNDGVSLEIGKRKKVLEKLGAKVKVVAGEGSADIRIRGLGIGNSSGFNKKAFEKGDVTEREFRKKKNLMKGKILAVLRKEKPDLVIVHNIFSLAYNLPATFALKEAIEETKVHTEAIHHDFWWDRDIFNTQSDFVRELLFELPPDIPEIVSHVTINSIDQEKLWKIRKIPSKVFGDLFDFEKTYRFRRDQIKKMLGIKDELVLLQATRPVRRKAIEVSVDVAAEAGGVLVLSNAPEKYVDADYMGLIRDYAEEKGVRLVEAYMQRKVPFFEFYKIGHFAMYPSIKEGFGNQFLEAVYYRVLPVVFEYPVFRKDLKPEGYKYISLGDRYRKCGWRVCVPEKRIKSAARKIRQYMKNREGYQRDVDWNFSVGRKNHSPRILEGYYRMIFSRLLLDKTFRTIGKVLDIRKSSR